MLNSSFDNSFNTKAARNLKKAILLDLNKPNNFKQNVETKKREELYSLDETDTYIQGQRSDFRMENTARGDQFNV